MKNEAHSCTWNRFNSIMYVMWNDRQREFGALWLTQGMFN